MTGRSVAEQPAAVKGVNSLWGWHHGRDPIIVAVNFIFLLVIRYSPFLQLKIECMKAMGIKAGQHVSMALEATVDIFYPELIEIGDNTVVGYRATILAHEYLIVYVQDWQGSSSERTS